VIVLGVVAVHGASFAGRPGRSDGGRCQQ
jgi:hypothetical protein